jgi:hypothetical protein
MTSHPLTASKIIANVAVSLGIGEHELRRLTPVEGHAEVRERLRTIEGQRETLARHEDVLTAFLALIKRAPINRSIDAFLQGGGK